MPIDVLWDDDGKTILRANFIGDWTWEEFDASDDALIRMAAEVTHRIDVISDYSKSGLGPPGNPLPHVGRGHNMMPANLGIVVAVRPPRLMQALAPMGEQIAGRTYRFAVNTLEQAYALIKANRRDADRPVDE